MATKSAIVLHKYSECVSGQLVKRYKRFLADVLVNTGAQQKQVTVYCPNTGPMSGLLQRELAPVMLSVSDNKKRKYAHTLEWIEVEDGIHVGAHSAIANTLAFQILDNNLIDQIGTPKTIKKEVKMGKSRLDFVVEDERGDEWYIEVKSATWALHTTQGKKIAVFPDTVSERAQKHMAALMDIHDKGLKSMCLYIIQRGDCATFSPSQEKDPEYAKLAKQAYEAGVQFVAVSVKYNSVVNQVEYFKKVPVVMQYDLETNQA
eukprot:TRINITY_DN8683_c2_g1_i5.p1 TRINITY_DN8683_c2_g1~~TRINITY_DN8683_c2_g1_i5.p1  ORF type:complete len:285 (-),score=35.56 TRINITY_DN8683_c2_g1_i5:197-979(-)